MADPVRMGRLAVLAPWHLRFENTAPLLRRVLAESTRLPDELWIIVEDEANAAVAMEAVDRYDLPMPIIEVRPTPRDPNGRPLVIPYSAAHNYVLDRTDADYIAYLDNGSMPHPEKYDLMTRALAANPEWGAVYCGQTRTGYRETTKHAEGVESDAFCILNYTQVMHRRTADRWTTDMGHAEPDLADALFWRELHKSLGPFYPVAPGLILDEHHIPDDKAAGI